MNKIDAIIEKAMTQDGKSCYVWGARGQNLLDKSDPASWIYSMETADSGMTRQQNTDRVITRLEKLKRKGINPILAFDCSGFVYWVYSSVGLMSERSNAQKYFNKCVEKKKDELKAGDLVFRHNGTKISHIGIYLGNGIVIHCKGRDYGCVAEKLTAYQWNRYGKWKGTYEDEQPTQQMVKALGTVRIRTMPSTEGQKLGTASNGQTFPYLGTAQTGWYEIRYKDMDAYISNKYTKLI